MHSDVGHKQLNTPTPTPSLLKKVWSKFHPLLSSPLPATVVSTAHRVTPAGAAHTFPDGCVHLEPTPQSV